jgi:hypothetical protein
LVSRYKDAPLRVLLTVPAVFYIGLNGTAAAIAMAVVHKVPWLSDDGDASAPSRLLIRALVAGTSAMAVIRASLFTIRVGNTDVSVGPAAFLQIILAAADRACDRERAGPRALAMQDIMAGISFQRAKLALPLFCFNLMQNVSADEQRTFGTIVNGLERTEMDDVFKANNLGLQLMNVVGEGVLRQAVKLLRADISAPPRLIVQSLATLRLVRRVQFETSAAFLADTCVFLTAKMEDASLRDQLTEAQSRLRDSGANDRQRLFLFVAVLIGRFSEDVVQMALRSMPENDSPGQSKL